MFDTSQEFIVLALIGKSEIKVLDDLNKGRWVAAKMHQEALRKERKLTPFTESYINASFFHKLGALSESADALQASEEQLNKILLTQQAQATAKGEMR